ncbi:expressed unknown protein [Seminavis robusta]|uniref:Uncharacterized protein n=1 Tax=Seminavis robusta TaxID=568900 RepID=A0A9N8ELA6_9STRA|nr:expressed unknown protein [Seminavis robusta]|eukprot:Sro1271_g258140.1 n/a (294) ;mRNA; f:26709-27590
MMMRTNNVGLTWISILLFCSSICQLPLVCASSSTETPSVVSVRALDEFGNSEQIQNARKAASLHGRLVVAARDSSQNCTIVLSLLEDHSPLKPSSILLEDAYSRMLQLLHNDPEHKLAMVCSGLRGDANWLLERVRAYSHRVWTRYNVFLGSSGAAHAVSQYMQRFWGFPEDAEWTPQLLLQEWKGNQGSWSRPLGLVVMIVSSSLPYIFVVEPSGIIQQYSAFAMGKYSDSVLEKLPTVINNDNDTKENEEDDLQEKLIKIIQSVVPSTKKDSRILVEIMSEKGVYRTVVVS